VQLGRPELLAPLKQLTDPNNVNPSRHHRSSKTGAVIELSYDIGT
jgi:hypothetical protein